MPRKLPEELENKFLTPLCLVTNLSEAKKVESILNGANVDFTFEKQEYFSGIFSSIKEGITFLVIDGQIDYCRNLLRNERLSKLIIE